MLRTTSLKMMHCFSSSTPWYIVNRFEIDAANALFSPRRGDMLSVSSAMCAPGGVVLLSLPGACIRNSRYLNETVSHTFSSASRPAFPLLPSISAILPLWDYCVLPGFNIVPK